LLFYEDINVLSLDKPFYTWEANIT